VNLSANNLGRNGAGPKRWVARSVVCVIAHAVTTTRFASSAAEITVAPPSRISMQNIQDQYAELSALASLARTVE
jgi:hypothetical protein